MTGSGTDIMSQFPFQTKPIYSLVAFGEAVQFLARLPNFRPFLGETLQILARLPNGNGGKGEGFAGGEKENEHGSESR